MCKYIQDLAAVWCKPWLHIRIHLIEDPAWMLIRSALIQQDSHSLTINEDIINRDMPHTGGLLFLTQPERRPTKRTGFNSERTLCLHLYRTNFYDPLNSDVWLNTNEFQLCVERYIFALVSVTCVRVCVYIACLNTNELQATIANLMPYFSRAILLNEPCSTGESVHTNIWAWGKLWPSKKSIICHHQVRPKRGLRNKTAQLWNFVFYQTSLSRSLLWLWMELARYTVPHIRAEIPASFHPRFSITECAGMDWRHLKRESTQYLLVLHCIELCSNRSSPLIISVTSTC